MSAGTFTVLNDAKIKLFNQVIKLNSDTFHVALLTNAVALSNTFVGSSTNAQYSDITSEVTGTGYTAGGATMGSPALTTSAGTVTFTGNSVSWTSATFAAKYAVIYDYTATNKDIVGYMDLDTGAPGGDAATNGTFTVNWNGSGIFTAA
jgi:hypothetical protein